MRNGQNFSLGRCVLIVTMTALAACRGGTVDSSASDGNASVQQDVTPPSTASYVSKVKNLMTGLPVTDAEVAQVMQDPDSLESLVTSWMATPQYRAKMQSFFGTAFQQTDVDAAALDSLPVSGSSSFFNTNMVSNVRSSFGLTVQELIDENQPFTQVLTTRRYMMTLPLMMLYAYADSQRGTDNGIQTNGLVSSNPNFTVYFQSAAVPSTASADPNDPNYMHWTFPVVANANNSNATLCSTDPIILDSNHDVGRGVGNIPPQLFVALLGIGAPQVYSQTDPNTICTIKSTWSSPVINPNDWNTWRMVTIRTPNAGEDTTKFFDVDKMRNGTELVLNNPRVGFFDTFAFQALWQTNVSNQFRVTMNQTLIVALGQAFDGSDQTKPLSTAAVDPNHAVPGTACYGCHMTMDPMRQFFHQNYTYGFAQQQNAKVIAMPGEFAWDGTSVAGNGLVDLANDLAADTRFASSWTQKLCTYARSGPCLATDPEFQRISNDFQQSNFNFATLAKEIFASPLTTFAQPTATSRQQGEVFPVNKRVHLCALLSERLNLNDVCALLPQTAVPSSLKVVQTVSTILPSDGYSRGAVAPTQANDPSLFYFSGAENMCKALANVLVDNGSASLYQSSSAPTAIADMVHNLMGIDSSRDTQPLQILQNHFTNAKATGVSATNALRSTFLLACLSPSTLGSGL